MEGVMTDTYYWGEYVKNLERERDALAVSLSKTALELQRLKDAAVPVIDFWISAKSAFAKEDVAMPAGVAIEPVQSEEWADITAEQLNELVRIFVEDEDG